MRLLSAVPALFLAFCLLPAGASLAKNPSITVAPGTPLCDTSADPVVCSWTTNGLPSDVNSYAVEVLASYDPDCDGTADLSRSFSFTTADATPMIDIAYAALDTTVCTSNDNPCTVSATYHARYVQMRVKALNPPSKHASGSQNNTFSALSDQVEIPGVCGVPCPKACVDGMNAFFATPPESGGSLSCSYDAAREAGHIDYHVESSTLAEGTIGFGGCFAVIDTSTILVRLGLSFAEQAACAIQFHDQFQALNPSTTCDISPP